MMHWINEGSLKWEMVAVPSEEPGLGESRKKNPSEIDILVQGEV